MKGIRRAASVGAVLGGALAVHMALDRPDMALLASCREDRPPPPSGGEDYARAMPNGRLVVLDGRRYPPSMQRPDAFDHAVELLETIQR